MHVPCQDKFPVPPPNLILALKPPPDRKGGAGAVTVFLRIFCPLLGRDGLLAGARKVLVSANAILHIQRGPPDPQPAREALADANTWPGQGSDTAAGSLGLGPRYPHFK